jgi:hypothetical protein
MKNIVVIYLVLGFLSPLAYVEASTAAELQKMILELQQKIKQQSVGQSTAVGDTSIDTGNENLEISTFDDGKDGKPKIVITAPTTKKSKFNKADAKDPIVVKWTAYNVPADTNLVLDLHNVKIQGPVGGGSAQFELPEGDSKGVYNWLIYGEGRPSAGKYRVQAGLEECSAKGCSTNAHFPGQEEDVELYAQSRSVGVTVVGKSPTPALSKDAAITFIDDTDTPNPTVTGTTKMGISSVGFSIGQGDLIYGSGPITVVNNRWSHTISENLKPGTYSLTLYVNNVKAEVRQLKITR